MPASVGFIVIDTMDPDGLVPFWSRLLGVEVESTVGDGQYVVLAATPGGYTIAFQRVPDAKAAPAVPTKRATSLLFVAVVLARTSDRSLDTCHAA
jgi:hypothetical protein